MKSISVRGVTVSVGDLAEDALKAFRPEDENPYKGFERSSLLDPGRPTGEGKSLDHLTSIHYMIGKKWYEVDFGLLEDNGPYRVKDITDFGNDEPSSSPENAASQGIAKGRDEAAVKNGVLHGLLTLQEFNDSAFCKTDKCTLWERWMLQDGTTNNVYQVYVCPEARVEVQTSHGNNVLSIGVSFYDLDRLRPKDFALIESLFHSIDQQGDGSPAARFVRNNVDTYVPQISDVKPLSLHGMLVRAGTVGGQQIVTITK